MELVFETDVRIQRLCSDRKSSFLGQNFSERCSANLIEHYRNKME